MFIEEDFKSVYCERYFCLTFFFFFSFFFFAQHLEYISQSLSRLFVISKFHCNGKMMHHVAR